MDKASAARIISDTFEKPFDKARFQYFIKNMLNQFDELKAFHAHGYVPEIFKEFVKTYERLGTYTDPENQKVDVLIVYLQKETSLERARTAQRNFVARYLKERGEKEAGLVAFVSPGQADWRFSLVKMEYHLEEAKVKRELTPARRWSFLVGSNESSHTAQSRLVPILVDDIHNPTLPQLEDAFNIEVVTKEFFNKYRDLFHDVKESLDNVAQKNEVIQRDFATKDVDSVNFSKKLLGQIVFLYFLQKKGWLGVPENKTWGEGDRKFLRTLFEKCQRERKNFFNDYLEYLFYDALNKQDRGSVDPSYCSRFNCKIPFLNGGLFDPINNYDWDHTDILLPNDLFSNSQKTKEGDTGAGIIDVFDRYNFTVKEDEPLEKEVAIDPEMLGKVFENLLEVKDRKSKGTYYTPREIVHYMCQESLINYLDTTINTGDIPLAQIRPPQGKLFGKPDPQQAALKTAEYRVIVPREDIEGFIRKGELAVENDSRVESKGKETERYSYKLPESIRHNARLIDEKLATVRVCDPAIGSGAFPVGMMTEIVRARKVLNTYLDDEKNRTNYIFKRHAIQNCLYGVDIDPGAVEIAKLRLWLSLVVDEENIQQIQPLPNLDYKIVRGNSLLGVERNMFNNELFQKLEDLKPLYFNETNVKKKHEFRKQIDQLIKSLTNNKETFDFWVYFSEVFHEKGGFDIIIANPPYGAEINPDELSQIMVKVRDTQNTNSAAIFIDLGKNRLLSEAGTLTFIVPKSLLYSAIWSSLVKAMLGKVSILVDVEKAFEEVKLEQVVFLYGEKLQVDRYLARKFLDREFITTTLIPNKLASKLQAWICGVTQEELSIVENLRTNCIFMRDISETKRGVPLQKYLSEKGHYHVIGGKNLMRYGYQGVKGFLERNHLEQNKRKLSFLQQPKIMSQNIVAHIQNPVPHILITATFDARGDVLSVDTVNNTVIKGNRYDPRYILAIINSRFISWYTYKFIYCSAIRTMHFDENYIGKIPIPNLNTAEQKALVNVVNEVLHITKGEDYLSNPAKQTKVRELECQIDLMVYKLYGLTPEEIAVVEGQNKN